MPAGSAAPATRNPRGRERTHTPPAITGTGTSGTQTQLLSSLRAGEPAPGVPLVRTPRSAGAGPCSWPAWEAHGRWQGSRSAQARGTGAKIRDSDKHRLRSQEGPGRGAWPDPDLRLSATAELPKIQISWEPHIPAPATHTHTHTHTCAHTHARTHTHAHALTHTHSYRKGTGSSWPSCTSGSPGPTGEPSVKAADLLGLDTTVLKAPLFQRWAAQGGHPNWVRAIANSAPRFTEPTGLLTPGRQLRRADTVTRGGTWLQIPQK